MQRRALKSCVKGDRAASPACCAVLTLMQVAPAAVLWQVMLDRKRAFSFLYRDGDKMVLMEDETFEQVEFLVEALGDQAAFLTVWLRVSGAAHVQTRDSHDVCSVLPRPSPRNPRAGRRWCDRGVL